MTDNRENILGGFLRDRRSKANPVALGLPAGRRRTPGLRREEVAQRANVSVTWYTWLEQGRGGAPSPEVLERISAALKLDDSEREHLFLLAFGRPYATRLQSGGSDIPRLRRIVDALEFSPALVRTATWDLVVWNRAARAVLADYDQMIPAQRNILRLVFSNPRVRSAQHDWENVARHVVAAFRTETHRAGTIDSAMALVEELSQLSPDFERIWKDNEVQSQGSGTKLIRHPTLGDLHLEYSALAVDGRSDLTLIIYNPMSPVDAERIRNLVRKMNDNHSTDTCATTFNTKMKISKCMPGNEIEAKS